MSVSASSSDPALERMRLRVVLLTIFNAVAG